MALQAVSIGAVLLSSVIFSPQSPWLRIEAGSEQRSPVYVGANPRAMELFGERAARPVLTESLSRKATRQARQIRKLLGVDTVELEAWPAQSEDGQRTWAFARWRANASEPWQWIEQTDFDKSVENFDGIASIELAPWRELQVGKIFDDFLTLKSLYEKPVFGECVWTDESGETLLGSWLPPSEIDEYRKLFTSSSYAQGARPVCHWVPQIARFNGEPFSVVIRVSAEGVEFPSDIEWVNDSVPESSEPDTRQRVTKWPSDFKKDYKRDVRLIAGEIDGRFQRKNSADPENQIGELVTYLERRYAVLGLKTYRQKFSWRGIDQYNLVAVIPGTAPEAEERPVVLADHIDTAFSDTHFSQTGERMSAPGADDNASAVATLLRAAAVLKNSKPKYDIYLLHLTGEEFPGDCLGARRYVSSLLKKKRDIRGLILLDMIGYKDPKYGNKFQINAGESAESVSLARLAYAAAASTAPHMEPVFRSRLDERSYLYNTDGVIFSDAGYPVILINEYINKLENLNRPHYHETTDTSKTMDFEYATSLAKIAIETAARLAETEWRY